MKRSMQGAMFNAMSHHRVTLGPYTIANKITISRFCKKHPKGKFYVCVRGHALAILDGVPSDNTSTRKFVCAAWRIYPPK